MDCGRDGLIDPPARLALEPAADERLQRVAARLEVGLVLIEHRPDLGLPDLEGGFERAGDLENTSPVRGADAVAPCGEERLAVGHGFTSSPVISAIRHPGLC